MKEHAEWQSTEALHLGEDHYQTRAEIRSHTEKSTFSKFGKSILVYAV